MVNIPDEHLPEHWRASIARREVAAALEGVYAHATDAIAQRGPACWASGRCCNFDKAGHRLYVTGLEAAYTLAKLPEIAGTSKSVFPDRVLRPLAIAQARQAGGCPFQLANLCGVHAIKPLACRLYFCDRSVQTWQNELSELLHSEVKGIHERFDVSYLYAEWRAMLEMLI